MTSAYDPNPEYNNPNPEVELYPSELELAAAKIVAAAAKRRPITDMLYREWSGSVAAGADTGDTISLDHAPEWWVIHIWAAGNAASNTLTVQQQSGDVQSYVAGTFDMRRVWPGNGNKVKIVNTGGLVAVFYSVVALRGYDPGKVG